MNYDPAIDGNAIVVSGVRALRCQDAYTEWICGQETDRGPLVEVGL